MKLTSLHNGRFVAGADRQHLEDTGGGPQEFFICVWLHDAHQFTRASTGQDDELHNTPNKQITQLSNKYVSNTVESLTWHYLTPERLTGFQDPSVRIPLHSVFLINSLIHDQPFQKTFFLHSFFDGDVCASISTCMHVCEGFLCYLWRYLVPPTSNC